MRKIISISLMMLLTSIFAFAQTYKGSTKGYLIGETEPTLGNPVLIFDLVENGGIYSLVYEGQSFLDNLTFTPNATGGTFSQTAPFDDGSSIYTVTNGSINGNSLEINYTRALPSAPDEPIWHFELRGDVFIDYNAADVADLKNFLEQPSAIEGKTNAQIIRSSFPAILPDDNSWIIAIEIYQSNFVWVINNGYAYLQKLNLPSSNLASEADFSACEYLEELNLQINSITGVSVSAGFNGMINLSQNAIPLSKLPVPANISSWNYQKQVINENLEYEETLEIDLSSEQIINGKTTQFLWMKTTLGAPGTLTLGVDYTENNGVFTFLNPSQLGESLRCTTINENFMSLSIAFTEYNFVLSPKIPTANETIAANSNHKPVAYYNTMGMKLQNEPANGIYIILYDNGSTEKRMK